MPKVSIIMNCFNGEAFLRQAINSIYSQTFDDWQIVFWDNASTDLTPDIARSYDSRLTYFRSNSLLTLGAARRMACEKATGEWIAFLDCDDYWLPNKLETQLGLLEGADYLFCYAGVNEINAKGELLRSVVPGFESGDIFANLLVEFNVNMATVMIRRAALDRYGMHFEDRITASTDYNLFCRLAAKGTVLTQPDILAAWRISPGSLTERQIAKWAVERYYSLDQIKIENPGIEARYPDAFRKAYARGDYYKARYLMSVGDFSGARESMSNILNIDFRYRLLSFAIIFPKFWNFIHGIGVKRRLLSALNIFF